MQYEDEKDYIMRMIKEATRVLFTLLSGKKYTHIELPQENKYEVSGNKLDVYKEMADQGNINEAKNLLENIDYNNKDEVIAAVFFYQYISNKGDSFLRQNNYSEEEVYEGLKELARKAGYENTNSILE